MRAEITSLFGLNVYTDVGTYIGKVSDLVLDATDRKINGLAISDINREDLKFLQKALSYRIDGL